jgi:decaprenyl-phosphate phosphoribosyltransferase
MRQVTAQLFQLMRPRQYLKNVAIFIGAGASGRLAQTENLVNLFFALCAFSALSSAVYILNDLQDLEFDRQHPRKKFRVLASGSVSQNSARFLMVLLLIVAFLNTFFTPPEIFYCLLTYFVLNVFYSLGGKNIVVLELLIVASGFVLRGLVGVYAVGADPSMWFNLLAMFASLLLVSGKRLAEKNNKEVEINRVTVQQYTQEFLVSIRTVSVAGLLMTYFLMVENKIQDIDIPEYSVMMQLSLLPFIYCVLALNYFMSRSDLEEPDTILAEFKPLIAGGLLWLILYGFAIYGIQI